MLRIGTILSLLLIVGVCYGADREQKTTLSCRVYDYQGDMIYYDCPQTPLIKAEFHRNPGEEHTYSFETDAPKTMYVNGTAIEFFLEPGDSLHVDITYREKLPSTMVFTGTERAVLQNELLWRIARMRIETRFKTSLLACVVLDMKPSQRIEEAKAYAERVKNMAQVSDEAYSEAFKSYLTAQTEGYLYESIVSYPDMYQEVRKLPIVEQGIGDYWSLLDGYKMRTDKVSMDCPTYSSFLLKYLLYCKQREAIRKGTTFPRPNKLETIYAEVASFFPQPQRDTMLFIVLTNYVRQGKGLERAEALIKDYKEKHNRDKHYMEILDYMMQ